MCWSHALWLIFHVCTFSCRMQWMMRSQWISYSVQNIQETGHQVPPGTLWWCDRPAISGKYNIYNIWMLSSGKRKPISCVTSQITLFSAPKTHNVVVVFIFWALAVIHSVGSGCLLNLGSCACQTDKLGGKLCMWEIEKYKWRRNHFTT